MGRVLHQIQIHAHTIQEAVEMEFCPSDMHREDGLCLSKFRKLLTPPFPDIA
jgi:hypothetical protein